MQLHLPETTLAAAEVVDAELPALEQGLGDRRPHFRRHCRGYYGEAHGHRAHAPRPRGQRQRFAGATQSARGLGELRSQCGQDARWKQARKVALSEVQGQGGSWIYRRQAELRRAVETPAIGLRAFAADQREAQAQPFGEVALQGAAADVIAADAQRCLKFGHGHVARPARDQAAQDDAADERVLRLVAARRRTWRVARINHFSHEPFPKGSSADHPARPSAALERSPQQPTCVCLD